MTGSQMGRILDEFIEPTERHLDAEAWLGRHARQQGTTVDALRARHVVVPCHCGAAGCEGWTLKRRATDQVILDRRVYEDERAVRKQVGRSHPGRAIASVTKRKLRHGKITATTGRSAADGYLGVPIWLVGLEPVKTT